MVDYKVFDILSIFEKILGHDFMYLTDAAKSGKLEEIVLHFDSHKDSNGVPIKLQHGVTLVWKE